MSIINRLKWFRLCCSLISTLFIGWIVISLTTWLEKKVGAEGVHIPKDTTLGNDTIKEEVKHD